MTLLPRPPFCTFTTYVAPAMMEQITKVSSQQSSEKAWVCCVLVSLHRGFNRVSIATRQNLTGVNKNKHAVPQ